MKRIKAQVRTCDRVIARKTNNCISLYYVDTQSKNEQNIYLHSVKFSPILDIRVRLYHSCIVLRDGIMKNWQS